SRRDVKLTYANGARRPTKKNWGGRRGRTGTKGGRLARGVHGLAVQELPDARGDPRGVEAVLGVEALRVAGLTESLNPEPLERRRHHIAEDLGHRAPEPAVDRVVLDRHDVAGLARRADEQLLVERLDGRRVDDLRRDPVGLQKPRGLDAIPERPARADERHIDTRTHP